VYGEAIRADKAVVRREIEDDQELLAVKEALPHGQFLRWLRAEFGWPERTARNFMAVAEQFGKSAIIAELPTQPTAAYLLAAPAVPDEAREGSPSRRPGPGRACTKRPSTLSGRGYAIG
jgi:hypothetical protein